jgi:hypothetical protein
MSFYSSTNLGVISEEEEDGIYPTNIIAESDDESEE